MNNKKIDTRDLTQMATYAALIVLAIYMIRIPMPSAISNTFVHPGNALVILAILFMGFKKGTIAALLGLAIFDITSGYLPVVLFTLIENFIVLLVVECVFRYVFYYDNRMRNIITLGIVGAVTKIVVIFFKYIVQQLMLGSVLSGAVASAISALPASLFTGVVTAILVPLLYWPIKPVFDRFK